MNIWAIIPLSTFLAYALVFALAVQRIDKRVNRVFVYYLGLAAFWSLTSFMMRLDVNPEHTLFWNRVLVVALIAALVAYYHFVLLYSGKKPGKIVTAGYLLMPLLLVISLSTSWVIESSYIADGVLHHKLGPVAYVTGALSVIYALSVLRLLWNKYRQSPDPIDRNRTAYLLAGWGIMAPLAYTNLIPGLKALPLDHTGSFINVAIIAYAITKYDLLDVRLVFRRGIGWFIILAFFGGLYAALMFAGLRLLPGVSPVAIGTLVSFIVIIVSLTARPMRKKIEELLDRLFHRQTYDHRQSLSEFSRIMGGNLNLEELAKELLPMLTNAINIVSSYLVLRDNSGGEFKTRFAFPKPEGINVDGMISFDPDSPVVSWLDSHREHLSIDKIDTLPEFKALWKDERSQLDKMGVRILVPVKSRDKMVAIIALGRKRDRRMYNAEDISIIENISSDVGVILENAQLYTFAVIKANTDELTGLYNHRHFHERLEQEVARGSRFGSTFSMIMLDIDLFKVYNDIYGHLAGDQVLRKVAQYIEASIRSIDLAFRYGGEEFTVILPEATTLDAYKVAERIRKTIEAKTSSRAMPITISLGVANWPNDGVMREEIIAAADTALYFSKNSGRNRASMSKDAPVLSSAGITGEAGRQDRSISIIYALAATVDAKDNYTYGHSRKVSDYAVSIAEEMKLSESQINTIRTAGLLHDIGKIGVPDSILNKKEPLTVTEWGPIRSHPEIGAEILKHVTELSECLPLILHHHERYDGRGYPGGLRGESIPVGARILTIADAYDAMTTARPYRGRMSGEEALTELRKHAGIQFDSELVEVFCQIMTLAHREAI